MKRNATAYVTYGLQVRLIKAGRVFVRTANIFKRNSLWSNYYLVEKPFNKGFVASLSTVPSVLQQVREAFCVYRTLSKGLFFLSALPHYSKRFLLKYNQLNKCSTDFYSISKVLVNKNRGFYISLVILCKNTRPPPKSV